MLAPAKRILRPYIRASGCFAVGKLGHMPLNLLPRILSATIGRHRLKRPRSAIHKNYLQSSVGFASAAAAGYKKRKVPAMARANGRLFEKGASPDPSRKTPARQGQHLSRRFSRVKGFMKPVSPSRSANRAEGVFQTRRGALSHPPRKSAAARRYARRTPQSLSATAPLSGEPIATRPCLS